MSLSCVAHAQNAYTQSSPSLILLNIRVVEAVQIGPSLPVSQPVYRRRAPFTSRLARRLHRPCVSEPDPCPCMHTLALMTLTRCCVQASKPALFCHPAISTSTQPANSLCLATAPKIAVRWWAGVARGDGGASKFVCCDAFMCSTLAG